MTTYSEKEISSTETPHGFSKDSEVIRQLLEYIDQRTTHCGKTAWREPTANYTCEERYQRELSFLKTQTIAFCPSVELTEPGTYLTRNLYDIPILVVRGDDGVVRAFRNACRHRGVEVASGKGKTRSFVCPYHAWTYGNDGTLKAVPHAAGFPDLDKCSRGLVAIGCSERLGMIFVSLDPNCQFDDTLQGVPHLVPEEYQIASIEDIELACNWKILLESFLEGYHIRSTHTKTFYPVQYDNLNVIEHIGKNTRIAFPYRSIEKLRNEEENDYDAEGRLTYVYQMFPNSLLSTHPGFRTVVIQQPTSIATTRQITYVLTNHQPKNTQEKARFDEVLALVNEAVVEDRNMVTSAQRGLTTAANTFFEFGLYESAIGHFHHHLTEELAKASV